MSKQKITKHVLFAILHKFYGNIPLMAQWLDKNFPETAKHVIDPETGQPMIIPRNYDSVYKLLSRNNLIAERQSIKASMDDAIKDNARLQLSRSVANGDFRAIKLIAESKLGFVKKEDLQAELRITISRQVITHTHLTRDHNPNEDH